MQQDENLLGEAAQQGVGLFDSAANRTGVKWGAGQKGIWDYKRRGGIPLLMSLVNTDDFSV